MWCSGLWLLFCSAWSPETLSDLSGERKSSEEYLGPVNTMNVNLEDTVWYVGGTPRTRKEVRSMIEQRMDILEMNRNEARQKSKVHYTSFNNLSQNAPRVGLSSQNDRRSLTFSSPLSMIFEGSALGR